MVLTLDWLAPNAPYMPIATAGLLALLDLEGHDAAAWWDDDDGRATLRLETSLTFDGLGTLIATAPWWDERRIRWPTGERGRAQALKPLLKATGRPLAAYREMVATAPEPEASLLRAIVTDSVLDDEGLPARNRLLRGVKADLTAAFKRPKKIDGEALAAELREGMRFRSDESGLGLGLGLVPEVQTFGGSTGPDPSSIDAWSPLLYLLLWRGIVALPPLPVKRGNGRSVGGHLTTDTDVISWPRWRVPVDIRGLRSLFALGEIHVDRPDLSRVSRRGIDRVYRARAVEINSMVAVYRWGEEVAAA